MGRSPCCEKEHTNKGAWTKEEDERLINYIKAHGEGCWRSLPKAAGCSNMKEFMCVCSGLQRCGKSCRTDNEIKNYWNTHIKRKLLNRGIDPQTHRPLQSAATTTTTTNAVPTTEKTTISNNKNNANYDPSSTSKTFQLINIQGSTLQFGLGSGLNFNPKPDPNIDIPTPITPVIRVSSISEDSNSTSSIVTSEEAYAEINLELSISLPSPSSETKSRQQQQQQQCTYQNFGIATTTTSMPGFSTRGGSVCLCYNLGFPNKGGCNCMSTTTIMGHDSLRGFYKPLSLS
ncbi:hypothetical protein Cgig2_005188 [Carnegiea gigantea]|uniref:Uncharacterized protein n=1 Tax=Carnegiea gigantea TaxID=171969 RepID=A0A9Q1KG65_9CARY|nr:hypothetical protein Cgig2_005188 [Carnegiea gigantea]